MLFTQHALGKAGLVVVGRHRYHSLDDDRPAIEFSGDEMDRRAMHPHAGLERPAVGMQSREGRQQRRMDVDQPPFVAGYEAVPEHAHETCQHHEIGRMGIDRTRQRGIEAFA